MQDERYAISNKTDFGFFDNRAYFPKKGETFA